MAPTLGDAKAFCRIETNDDDSILTLMLGAATDYVKRIGVDTDASPLPDSVTLAILMLTSFFFDHRDAFNDGMSEAHNAVIDRMLAPVREIYV
jgi:uncharacterized phage protein (predicted DNA packaging)